MGGELGRRLLLLGIPCQGLSERRCRVICSGVGGWSALTNPILLTLVRDCLLSRSVDSAEALVTTPPGNSCFAFHINSWKGSLLLRGIALRGE